MRFLPFILFCAINTFAGSGVVNGISYEESGTGTPVVLIHGGQLDRRMWDAQTPVFEKNFHVIRYDLRGFGKSGEPKEPFSHDEDLARLLDHLRVEEASLVGLSLGAAVAVDFALTHSNRVTSLLLVCPGLGGFPFRDPANNLAPIANVARDHGAKAAADLWLANPYMSVAMEDPSLRTKLRQFAEENWRCWLVNPVWQRRLEPPAYVRLKEIGARTLVVDGARDVSDIHNIVNKLVSDIQGARKAAIKGAGHLVPMEKAEAFNRLAVDFLSSKSNP